MKKKRQLEPEQAAAAYTVDRHVSVTAGPGSGKTTVLVERYLHILLKHNLSIDQIVAITFTNRAANEMRERLREQLDQLLQSAASDTRQLLLSYKRTLDGAVITTIHGFCSRLLREFPVEARVDPQFLLLDEHRAAMLLEAVVEEVLNEFISLGHVKISRLTLGVGRGRLATAIAQIYRDVRGQGLALNELAVKTAATHVSEEDHANALAELSEAMKRFSAIRATTAAQIEKQRKAMKGWSELEQLLKKTPTPETLADYCRSVADFRKLRPNAQGSFTDGVKTLDELIWEKELAGRVPQLCLDRFAQDYALELIHLLIRVAERLEEEKHKLSALDFADLELKALALLERPEVITRATERYKFFLVDEFQDTNSLQRRLLEQLALQTSRRERANLFIVGDRKQSIYGFRGADVDVFREMTETLTKSGGVSQPLLLNFRSQPPLVNFFNCLFARLFEPRDPVNAQEREELGYVAHEPSVPKRELSEEGPLVELLVSTETAAEGDIENDPRAELSSREIDAEQVAQRIRALVTQGAKYSDMALLFRALTNVQTYESVFRRANIPYQTVLGRGFYAREEITDLVQLLRFLDNKTDELALAAVLRSPLVGLSDNALLALRCAPWLRDAETGDPLYHFTNTRRLFTALQRHREISYIDEAEHELLEGAAGFISELVKRRHHYALDELLRYAVERSEYQTVIAANFDGAQRLANVERLYTLAARFEQSGTYLIRDFVRYVEDFEAIGSRESEGQIDEAANAVRLMTIHQAKGLEFPIVIIPELQRYSRVPDNWFLLDRHRGLTLKVPDGRSNLVAGYSFTTFEQRNSWREEFESMRLLYVAATRAEDRLIFSGTTKDLDSLNAKPETWLRWIWQSLDLGSRSQSGVVTLAEGVELMLSLNPVTSAVSAPEESAAGEPPIPEAVGSLAEAFPLMHPIAPDDSDALQRLSVTQLINYQRCPRQYYFDRVLRVPSVDELAVWNNAEAPEPPANLNATLKGAVIHRFCETFFPGDDPEERLKQSFADVIRARQAQLVDRLGEINEAEALKELWPLAQNYLASAVFSRAEAIRKVSGAKPHQQPAAAAGLWSELSFRLRRPWGMLTGTIDKLLISQAAHGDGFEIEIIDFKTNRIIRPATSQRDAAINQVVDEPPALTTAVVKAKRSRAQSKAVANQFAFEFSEAKPREAVDVDSEAGGSIAEQVRVAASDYQLQMQAYALAVYELMPELIKKGCRIRATLHFLHPNVEWTLPQEMLSPEMCSASLDEAMRQISNSCGPEDFPVRPARHCGMCSFLRICYAGRQTMPHRISRTPLLGVVAATSR
ncbi:MAG: UvrD-helicase domain-containing protein [Acidobacteriota bacterium]|nr:UvrD-helicase domain-containing protein [Acidobacteriota bacterium]